MNKEEILKIFRKENEANDPYEKEISSFAWKIGAIVAFGLSVVIFCFELIFRGNYNYGLFISLVSILAVKFTLEAIKLKKAWSIAFAIIYSCVFVIIVVVCIIAFLNGWI